MTIDAWDEQYAFVCVRCGHEWIADYEVRRYRSVSGREWMVYCRDGQPVRPPHLDSMCPRCGGLRVKHFPRPADKAERATSCARAAQA